MTEGEFVLVKTIRRKNQAALVEYQDTELGTMRVIVPEKFVEEWDNGKEYCPLEELEMGIPYGIPWEVRLIDFVIPASAIAKALRQSGIWTYEDFNTKPNEVLSAVRSAQTPILRKVREIAVEHRNKEV